MKEARTPPFIGIRIKSFGEEWKLRGARTLEIFLDTLLSGPPAHCPKICGHAAKVNIPSNRAPWFGCSKSWKIAIIWRPARCVSS